MTEGNVDYQISVLIWNAIFFAFGLIGFVLSRKRFDFRWYLAAVFLFNMNVALALEFFGINDFLYAVVDGIDPQFNWAGKISALVFSILVLATPMIDRREAGITLKQSHKAHIGWGVFAILIGVLLYISFQSENDSVSIETIAYQLTMPSLDEEVFFRGTLLYALVKAMGTGPRIFFANFGWGALTSSVLFGVLHSVFWVDGSISFSVEIFIVTGLIGLILTWLRLNTGSIVVPVLLHSAINTIPKVL